MILRKKQSMVMLCVLGIRVVVVKYETYKKSIFKILGKEHKGEHLLRKVPQGELR